MRDYRIVMASPHTEFVIYVKAINEHEAVKQANEQYAPDFVAVRDKVTKIMSQKKLDKWSEFDTPAKCAMGKARIVKKEGR